jgi:MarR family transcriptional regulator, lower aerobic nicotinate degradation pathway regulator
LSKHSGAGDPTETDPERASEAESPYVLEEQVGHLLRRAHQRATAIFIAELGDVFDLTPTQYAALVKLYDSGEQSQNQLGRLTAMDPATIQGVIRRLEYRRLIERTVDPVDRRRTRLQLTEAGRTLAAAARTFGFRVSDRTLEPLGPDERTLFLSLLGRLI